MHPAACVIAVAGLYVYGKSVRMIHWQRLLAEHGPNMYRAACRILGRGEDAEDCLQEIFLELLAREDPPAADNWSAMLRWMVTVRAIDRLRRTRSQREVGPEPLDTTAARGDDPAAQASAAEIGEWLRATLAELPPRRAQVFALRYFADMSYADIASVVEIERNAVGTILHDARRQLRTMIPGEWVEDWRARDGHAGT